MPARSSQLISAQVLQSRLHEPGFCIFDTRFSLQDRAYGQRSYASGHLPGAQYLDLEKDLSGPVQAHGGRHPLPAFEVLASKLRSCGLNQDSVAVVYDDAGSMYAVRLWWQLRYLGLKQVYVLDGGLQAWEAAGFPLESHSPMPASGNFQARPEARKLISAHELKARLHQPGLLLLDARAPERYRGETEPLDPKAGHIPGARNRPFRDNLKGAYFKAPEELQYELQPLGADTSSEIVVYCGSGVTANHVILALLEAGLPEARLYAGSWSDWSSYADFPVALGTEPDPAD